MDAKEARESNMIRVHIIPYCRIKEGMAILIENGQALHPREFYPNTYVEKKYFNNTANLNIGLMITNAISKIIKGYLPNNELLSIKNFNISSTNNDYKYLLYKNEIYCSVSFLISRDKIIALKDEPVIFENNNLMLRSKLYVLVYEENGLQHHEGSIMFQTKDITVDEEYDIIYDVLEPIDE